MIKIKGLDKLTKKTKQLSNFAEEIDGDLASVAFDPHDTASIEAAIQQAHDAIDEKAEGYGRNDWVEAIVEQLKEGAREQILERAAAVRLEGETE